MGLRDEEIRLHVKPFTDTVDVDDQLLIDETEKATNAKTARDLKFAKAALEKKKKVQSLALAATTAVDAAAAAASVVPPVASSCAPSQDSDAFFDQMKDLIGRELKTAVGPLKGEINVLKKQVASVNAMGQAPQPYFPMPHQLPHFPPPPAQVPSVNAIAQSSPQQYFVPPPAQPAPHPQQPQYPPMQHLPQVSNFVNAPPHHVSSIANAPPQNPPQQPLPATQVPAAPAHSPQMDDFMSRMLSLLSTRDGFSAGRGRGNGGQWQKTNNVGQGRGRGNGNGGGGQRNSGPFNNRCSICRAGNALSCNHCLICHDVTHVRWQCPKRNDPNWTPLN